MIGTLLISVPRYIRISSRSDIERVRELLVDYWGFLKPRKPYLALSLIGGAKNFRMEGKKKETFKRGLIEAARGAIQLLRFLCRFLQALQPH